MTGSVNKAIIVGHLGRDPESRSFQNGGKIVSLRVATSESWRDKASGERKEKTEWHSVSITNEALAKVAEQYLRKGSMVYIEGQIETRKWQDKDGADRYSTEIAVRAFNGVLTLLDKRHVVNAFVGWQPNGAELKVKLSAENLLKEEYYVYGNVIGGAYAMRAPGDPQTFRISVNYAY